MNDPVVIVGLGQLGGIFAHGFLRQGRTVHPVTRSQTMKDVARDVPSPALALIAVAEGDLDPILASLPASWRDRIALLQNELLPGDWARHDLRDPSVAVVWFEKKKSIAPRVILPTYIAGPHAELMVGALSEVDIAAGAIERDALLFELVRKNLYILTSNIAGLEVGGTVGELWSRHRGLASDVAAEVLVIQAWRAGEPLPERALVDAMAEAFDADPEHPCRGRSAPARLARALGTAHRAGLRVPTLERISARLA